MNGGSRKLFSDFQRQVIIFLKSENPTWGLTKCLVVSLNFFSMITKHPFDNVAATLKPEGPEAAATCQKGTGEKNKFQMKYMPQ